MIRTILAIGIGLAAARFGMALSRNVPMLFLSVLGLRLTGQGLLSLTASTTMAREFDEGRGKALSVSALGYPLGEGLLPLAVVLMIHGLGWRMSWMLVGAASLVTVDECNVAIIWFLCHSGFPIAFQAFTITIIP